jgi:hypothetical protein
MMKENVIFSGYAFLPKKIGELITSFKQFC